MGETRTWETLEAFARRGMQQLRQRMLEEQVDGLLGRGRYERRDAVDPAAGYRKSVACRIPSDAVTRCWVPVAPARDEV